MRGPRLLETTIQVVLADMSRGADAIPKASQASRSAQADLRPMRFTWVPRSDVNEPDAIGPRRCDGRPTDPRICPQAESTGGRAPATPHGWVCCAVTAHSRAPGQRSGVNGPGPPRPAGGLEPEGAPLVGAWRSQAATVNGPKSVVQTRSWPRGDASAGCWRSRRPAVTGRGPVTRPATAWRRSVYRLIDR